jgi:hypothetical protein
VAQDLVKARTLVQKQPDKRLQRQHGRKMQSVLGGKAMPQIEIRCRSGVVRAGRLPLPSRTLARLARHKLAHMQNKDDMQKR